MSNLCKICEVDIKYVGSKCRDCYNKNQREKRLENNNKATHIYEKTIKGFLMRCYRNMKSRISGVQKAKHHLYKDKELLEKTVFYEWSLSNTNFLRLFDEWSLNNYERTLTPSVDRLDSSKGYLISNMEWVTHSENSRRGVLSKNMQKRAVELEVDHHS